jgi:hypothetical protein
MKTETERTEEMEKSPPSVMIHHVDEDEAAPCDDSKLKVFSNPFDYSKSLYWYPYNIVGAPQLNISVDGRIHLHDHTIKSISAITS